MSSIRIMMCELLLEVAQAEKQIEIVRSLLCELATFHPYSVFKMLHGGKGYIDEEDVKILLNRMGFPSTNSLVYIHNYDVDDDNRLSYSE